MNNVIDIAATSARRRFALALLVALLAAPAVRAATPAEKPVKAGATRTLEAITIEGEVAVPQVLFITARDVRRFHDGLGATYQLKAIDVSRATLLPGRACVLAPRMTNKEETR
jgi:hypothetical protein